MNKTISIITCILILLTACTQSSITGEATTQDEIRIGVSLPLTGEAPSFGEATLAGALLAEHEINQAGGINGKPLRLIIEDDKCGKNSINAIQKFIGTDQVTAITGLLCSGAAAAIAPIVEEEGVPTIVMGSAPHLTINKEFVYRIYPSDKAAATFMADYVYHELGLTKAAMVYTQNDWGQGVRDSFNQHFADIGGSIVIDEGVAGDQRDLRTIVSKIKASDAEIIVSPTYPTNAIALMQQLKEQGVDIPKISSDGWGVSDVYEEPAAEGAMYITANIKGTKELRERMREHSGYDQEHIFAVTTYDEIYVLADTIREVGTNPDSIREALAKNTYKGMSADTIKFDENGDIISNDFTIWEIHDGESVIKE